VLWSSNQAGDLQLDRQKDRSRDLGKLSPHRAACRARLAALIAVFFAALCCTNRQLGTFLLELMLLLLLLLLLSLLSTQVINCGHRQAQHTQSQFHDSFSHDT